MFLNSNKCQKKQTVKTVFIDEYKAKFKPDGLMMALLTEKLL